MRTQRYDQRNGVFVLADRLSGQVVTFWPLTKSIDVHTAEPHGSLTPHADECEYLPGRAVYCGGSSVSGAALLDRWEQSGRDDQIVWDELGRWYDTYFPARQEA